MALPDAYGLFLISTPVDELPEEVQDVLEVVRLDDIAALAVDQMNRVRSRR